MTLLRSREVPSPTVKPQLKTLKPNLDIEPATPARTHVHTVDQSLQDPAVGPKPVGSGSGSGSVSIRRRSLRLASKSDGCECPGGGGSTEAVNVGSRGHRSGREASGNGLIQDGVVTRSKRKLTVEDGVVSEFGEGERNRFSSSRSGKRAVKKKVENEAVCGKKTEPEIKDNRKSKIVNGKFVPDPELRSLDENAKEIPQDQKIEMTSLRNTLQDRTEIDNEEIKVVDDCLIVNENLNTEPGVLLDVEMLENLEKKKKGKTVVGDLLEDIVESKNIEEDSVFYGPSNSKGRRYTREEKGKGIMVENATTFDGDANVDVGVEMEIKNSFSNSVISDVVEQEKSLGLEVKDKSKKTKNEQKKESRTQQFHDIAKKNASRFAYFDAEEEDDGLSDGVPEGQVDDWPGPFSTAMKIIRDREEKNNLQLGADNSVKNESVPLTWVPKKAQGVIPRNAQAPSLQELSMKLLAKNADAIVSLDDVPDALRHKLSRLLCDSRRINIHFLDLLVQGSPTEICLPDCSWLSEEQFTECFERCDTSNLTVLQLDQCGRCMPDYILLSTLARSTESLPMLSALSLSGACRLSDVGLQALVSAAPTLRSINLSQCSFLTSSSIDILADTLGSVLRELYLDDCVGIDPMLVQPALKKLGNLEVLSVAGIQSISNRFIREVVTTLGPNLKELILTDCVRLTDSSIRVIGESCPGLRALDLVNLCKLSDSALGYLANGCGSMEKLILTRNPFSDEAVAAFLETTGESLRELSLNNVRKVGNCTALSLAKRSRKLQRLDLSWCRNLTNEALGLIVDNCLSLSVLELFGCSQITNVVLDGHSNSNVKIIGLKMSSVLEHLKVSDRLDAHHCS